MTHGVVKEGWLIKRDKQVVKFWKHNGYAIPLSDLLNVKGVILYTKYDGILYQDSAVIMRKGIPNRFKDERQMVLPVADWRVRDTTRET